MNMSADLWSEVLWAHYESEIRSGSPFYLAAEARTLVEISKNFNGLSEPAEVLDSFTTACFSLLERFSTRATVKPVAYTKLVGKHYSRAICLAVQQVLVVETMLKDTFSENSYFPRYRQLLKLGGSNAHENPLGAAFQKIWEVLRQEISFVEGSQSSSVTFRAGSGRNLNRNFPLSQALLTKQDLLNLYEGFIGSDLPTNDAQLVAYLFGLRSCLNSKRAHDLISKASEHENLRQRLCEQIRSFRPAEESANHAQPEGMAEGKERYTLTAFYQTECWTEERYKFFLCSITGEEKPATMNEFNSLMKGGHGIALSRQEFGFTPIAKDNPFLVGDFILAVVRSGQSSQFESRFNSEYGRPPLRCQSNLPDELAVFRCGSLVHGRVFDQRGLVEASEENQIVLTGGIEIDRRNHSFPCGYPPASIVHKGVKIPPGTAIMVNDIRRKCGEFLTSLRSVTDFRSFILQINEDSLEFCLTPEKRNNKRTQIGYTLLGNELSPIAIIASEADIGYRGTLFYKTKSNSLLENWEFSELDLLCLVQEGERIPISKQLLEIVLYNLDEIRTTNSLAKVAFNQIRLLRSIPVKAYQRPNFKRLNASITVPS